MSAFKHGFIRGGLLLLQLVTHLPLPGLLGLGKLLGGLTYWAMPKRRAIALTNVRLCLPELSADEQQRLVKASFRSVGAAILETALSWWGKRDRLAPLCHLHGLQHLQQAHAQGQGVLLLSAHFTSLEIGGRLLALHQPFAVMYKPHRNPVMEAVIRQSRQTHYQAAIKQDDLRGFIKALKDGMVCWYAPDQDLGLHRSVFAPFFGVPAATITAPARFAKLTGARVVPFFSLRRADGRGYDLKILPALENFPSGDEVADASRINAIIETQARETPEQYLWAHRRFKTRPPGEADLYS